MRPLRRSRLDEDIAILRDIFNDAWSDNWGFVPFTEAEFHAMANDLVRLVDDDFVQIAEVDGEPAAMIAIFPLGSGSPSWSVSQQSGLSN